MHDPLSQDAQTQDQQQAREQQPALTLDQAVAEFQALANEMLGDAPPGTAAAPAPRSPEEREAGLFGFAEAVIGLVCPDPLACEEQRCRRNAVCRHLARVRGKQASGQSVHPRRTPGAEAVRYAMWVFMSADRRLAGQAGVPARDRTIEPD